MRKYAIENPYDKLKQLSRGKKLTQEMIHEFIYSLEIPQTEKDKLIKLTPELYIGIANKFF